MKCPHCGSNVTQPKESRSVNDNTLRYRKYRCVKCHKEFSTIEDYYQNN